MKREFLQNIKVGDQALPKEIIDSILNEHSRSIGAIKAEKESLATQLQTAKDGLKAFEGVDVKDHLGANIFLSGRNSLLTKRVTCAIISKLS